MILRGELYKITGSNVETDNAAYEITLNRESFIYQAHFPGMPITPGVCIIEIATELLSDAVGKTLELQSVKNAKFLVPLIPDGKEVKVKISKIKEISENKMSAQVMIADTQDSVYARISLETTIA